MASKEIEQILNHFFIRLSEAVVPKHLLTLNLSGFSVGTGVNIVNSNKLHSQGSIVSTDNALDLAIDGGGFFQIAFT